MVSGIIKKKYKDEINEILCNIDNEKYIKIYKYKR